MRQTRDRYPARRCALCAELPEQYCHFSRVEMLMEPEVGGPGSAGALTNQGNRRPAARAKRCRRGVRVDRRVRHHA